MTRPRGNGPSGTRRPARPRRVADSRTAGRTCRSPEVPVHVLFVAKPRAFRESVAYFTCLLGHAISTVASVAAALTVLTRDAVDIVVVDDDLDVPALLAAVHQAGGPEVLVLVITVAVTKAEMVRWAQAGAFACVPKPFDLRAYRLALERAVAAVRTRRARGT